MPIRRPALAPRAAWVFAFISLSRSTLIAYIDAVGAFISKNHSNFNTSPVFGYADFVTPERYVHDASRDAATTKQRFYPLLYGQGREETGKCVPTWERRGSELLNV